MNWDEVIGFWGKSNLIRWPRDSLQDLTISETCKSYLAEVGLPSAVDETFTFGPEEGRIPRLDGKPRYRRIGFDYLTPICLDEQDHGHVMEIRTLPGGMDRYINCDVEHFGACLVYF